MRKSVKGKVRIEILLTPEEVSNLQVCANLTHTSRVDFIRGIVRWAYGSAVKRNLVPQEVANGEPSQVSA